MLEMYKGFVENYGCITIEDPYEQDDWDNWKTITAELGVRPPFGGEGRGRARRAVLRGACGRGRSRRAALRGGRSGAGGEAVWG
jgi:hypothetical protein